MYEINQKQRFPRPEADPSHGFRSKFQPITNRKGFRVHGLGSVVHACDISREMQETISGVKKTQACLCFSLQL